MIDVSDSPSTGVELRDGDRDSKLGIGLDAANGVHLVQRQPPHTAHGTAASIGRKNINHEFFILMAETFE
jgi:hypothetical protein